MAKETRVKVAGVWRNVKDVYVKVGGTWRTLTGAFVKVGGTWKEVLSTAFDFANNGFTVAFLYGGTVTTSNTNAIKRWNGTTASTEAATLSSINAHSAAAHLNNANYIFGGHNQSVRLNVIAKYDGSTRTNVGTMAAATQNAGACFLNNFNYVYAGQEAAWTTTIRRWDEATITNVGSGLQHGMFRGDHVAWMDNKNYMYGGYDTSSFASRLEIQKYDEVSATFEAATLATTAQSAGAEWLSGVNYIFGGYSTGNLNTIQRYDGVTRSTMGATLNTALYCGHTVHTNDLIYVMGGISTAGYSSTIHNFVSRWNGTTYTVVGSLPTTLGYSSTAAM